MTQRKPGKAPAPAAPPQPEGSPPEGQFQVDPVRVLAKLEQDPQGLLYVRSAMQACVIEDQQETIRQLQDELIKKTKEGRDDGSDG